MRSMTDDYQAALEIAGRIKGVNPSAIDRRLVMPIVYHESMGDIENQFLVQKNGGPGRGVVQFEGAIGDGLGFESAVNRAKAFYQKQGMQLPSYISSLKKGQDATALTVPQQKALMLYDFLEKPTRQLGGKPIDVPADLALVVRGEVPVVTWWEHYHWAGPQMSESDRMVRDDRIASFRESQVAFLNSLPEGDAIPLPDSPSQEQEPDGLFERYLRGVKDVFKGYFAEVQKPTEKDVS